MNKEEQLWSYIFIVNAANDAKFTCKILSSSDLQKCLVDYSVRVEVNRVEVNRHNVRHPQHPFFELRIFGFL